ncbi:SCO family protein [Flavobacterium capsici]|uniref:SCO family protein n=1 Tax=Flavobacterium capsici TaxID=3075618 RepID=A0AA96J2R7_9FLAO|nr:MULTISPECIES: SCO family protein [unclassified Flavobacterium]WNM19335.1 SCO family protein [Flavobacterium sp. PMR2A8]WNM20724.1 SCO family protein [Flavobacterium sp. PMTSA4]
MKSKSYIGISLVILVFGIIFIPKIIDRVKNGTVVQGDRIDAVSNHKNQNIETGLVTIGPEPSFSLTNQNDKTVTNKDYNGKVHVVEFFFSTCPTICPIMNKNMMVIEKEFPGNPNFGIASITINPENDTPKVLKEHAEALGVTSSNWNFLTGNQDYILNLATKGFNLYAGQNSNVNGGFEHSGYFALVDKKGNIRSRKDANGNPIIYYNGLENDDIKAIIKDIKILLNE